MTETRKYIEEHRYEMTELLAELVAVPSVQGEAADGCPFGEEPARALVIMLEKCRDYGFSVENVDNYAGSADFGGEPALAILSHLDVVPAGSGWSSDPFALTRDGDKLIGRGAIDDKGPAVAAVFALRAIKELGIPLKKGVRLIFGERGERLSRPRILPQKARAPADGVHSRRRVPRHQRGKGDVEGLFFGKLGLPCRALGGNRDKCRSRELRDKVRVRPEKRLRCQP